MFEAISRQAFPWKWPALLIAHAMLSLLAVYYARWRIARDESGLGWPAFVFSFCFFLPGLGLIGLLLVILPAMAKAARPAPRAFGMLTAAFPAAFGETAGTAVSPTGYGPGGFRARLLSRRIPLAGRLQSLYALRHRATPQGNRMMKELLKDPSDELRLMAFGTLERRELELQDSIRKAKAEAKVATGDALGACLRTLAFLNWELVFQELVEGELSDFYLDRALEYAVRATDVSPGESSLWALQGRILARMGEWEKANLAFASASELGAPAQRILPRLAEVAFQRRDFRETRRLLSQAGELRHVPALEPILRFWIGARA